MADALKMIFERNAFYKRQFSLALGALLLCLIVIGILLWLFFYLYSNPTKPLYFAADNTGRLLLEIPVDQPNMSNDEVAAWVVEALESAFSYNFVNFRSQLQKSQKYFSRYSWDEYMAKLQDTGNLLTVTEFKWIASAKVIQKPVLEREGLLGGTYAWRYHVRLLVTYLKPPYNFNDPSLKNFASLEVAVIVQRQPLLKSDRGLAIVQMIANYGKVTPPALSPK